MHKNTCCDPSSEHLDETVQMRGHNIHFRWEIRTFFLSPNTPSYLEHWTQFSIARILCLTIFSLNLLLKVDYSSDFLDCTFTSVWENLLMIFSEMQVLYDLEDSLNGDRKGFDKLIVSLRLVTYWISVRKYIFHASRVGVCWIKNVQWLG